MTNNNLIPFSKELWETGEYELENKDIVTIQEIFGNNVYYRYYNSWLNDWETTKHDINSTEHSQDLMLRKKTKKKWTAIVNSDLYDTEQECMDYWAGSGVFIKAIEVEI